MKDMDRVELGDEVKEVTTGMQGIAIARHNYLYSCVRVSVQPPVEENGKYVDSCSFDAPQLEIITKGKVKYVPQACENIVQLGDEVIDTITDFKGIAVVRSQYLTGGDRIGVQPKMDSKGKISDHQTFDEPQLKVIRSKKPEVKEAKAVDAKKANSPDTYGPEKHRDQGKVGGGHRDVAPRR